MLNKPRYNMVYQASAGKKGGWVGVGGGGGAVKSPASALMTAAH